MKEKRDCKIVQDLLPNYIEKLTNDETNKYIEEHLNNCEDCKRTFENMKKDLNISNSEKRKEQQKQQEREINYIKKFNKKFKLLRNILLIILALFIILVGRKTIILTSLTNKAEESENSKNYYLKLESYSDGRMTITEAYSKDEKELVKISIFSQDSEIIQQTLYKSESESFSLIDNGDKKVYTKMGDIKVSPISFTSQFFIENVITAITTSIEKVDLNGKECYMLRDRNDNTEKFIDVNTGLAIKMIDNKNNRTVDYEYVYGIVEDSDVERPDTTGYKIIE